jgi:hypothetical protein
MAVIHSSILPLSIYLHNHLLLLSSMSLSVYKAHSLLFNDIILFPTTFHSLFLNFS